jgi:hypothetical protein
MIELSIAKLSVKSSRAGGITLDTQIPGNCAKAIVNVSRVESSNSRSKLEVRVEPGILRCFMRPHLSLLIVVIALGSSSGVIAASTSTSSGGGGAGSAAGGGTHAGSGGGGGHSGGVAGHGALGGGFSNGGRSGSTNLGRGSFSQAIGNHAAEHAIATRTALRTTSRAEPDKTHPGNPEHHHHHHRFSRDAYPTQLTDAFGSCAALRFDREQDFVVGPNLLCGSVRKTPTNLRTGRPAG